MKQAVLAAIITAGLVLAGVAVGARYVGSLTQAAPAQPLGFYSGGGPSPLITMQSAITETANGTAIQMAGSQMAMIQVEGISGDTITFEATIDGSTWYAVAMVSPTSTTRARATTATADGLYFLEPTAGLSQLRARISTYGAGTITVVGRRQ